MPAAASHGWSLRRTFARSFIEHAMPGWPGDYGPRTTVGAFAQRLDLVHAAACAHTERAMKFDSKYFDCVRVKPDHEKVVRRGGAGLPVEGLQRRRPAPRAQGARARGRVLPALPRARARSSTPPTITSQGMSNADIEAYQKDSVTGHRPTWKVGANSWAHGTRHGMGAHGRIRPRASPTRTSSSPGARPDPRRRAAPDASSRWS